jgi:hypothetical protein
MVSRLEVLNDILILLDKAENRTLSFSFLLQTSTLSRREFFYLFDNLERIGFVSHTIDFWGDPQSYTLLVRLEEINVTTIQVHL